MTLVKPISSIFLPLQYDGTFSDHLEMLVQMGYVVLFSAAFPLAGICALINNLMEIRSDAFKLAHVHQRPFGQRVANIGTWQNALSILSLAAVIVNCALIGLSGQVSRLWPGLTTAQTIILIVTLEVRANGKYFIYLRMHKDFMNFDCFMCSILCWACGRR